MGEQTRFPFFLYLGLCRIRKRMEISISLLQKWRRCIPYCLLHSNDILWYSNFLPRSGYRSILRFRWHDFGRPTLSSFQRRRNSNNGPSILPRYLLLRNHRMDHLLYDSNIHKNSQVTMGHLRCLVEHRQLLSSFRQHD